MVSLRTNYHRKICKSLSWRKKVGILLGNISDVASLRRRIFHRMGNTKQNRRQKTHECFCRTEIGKASWGNWKRTGRNSERFFSSAQKNLQKISFSLNLPSLKGSQKFLRKTRNRKAMEPFFTHGTGGMEKNTQKRQMPFSFLWKRHSNPFSLVLLSLSRKKPLIHFAPLFPNVLKSFKTRRTRQLWEAKTLADTGNVALAEAILEEVSGTDLVGIGTTSPKLPQKF